MPRKTTPDSPAINATALRISAIGSAAGPLSPEHERFETLLDKIDKARLRLQTWQQQLPLFAQAHSQRVGPLLTELRQLQRAWAFDLEQRLLQNRWSKIDQGLLADRIAALSADLLMRTPEDAELKALHDRHAEQDHDTQTQQQVDAMRAVIEADDGVDLGPEPITSIEELLRRARAAQQRALEKRDNDPAHRQALEKAAQARQRAEAKAQRQPQSAAARRAAVEQQQVSQTVREVYRKLASVLHPDRTDAAATPAQRQQRTDCMAAANSAYAAGDLLALLTLQLQIEQVSPERAAGMAAAQLKHVNKLLDQQLLALERESDERQAALCESYDLVPRQRLDPARLDRVIQEAMAQLQTACAQIALERRWLSGGPAQAKRWLKQLRDTDYAAS